MSNVIPAIRGYKLILWGSRLDIFDTSMIDPKGINLIYKVLPVDEQQSRVYLYLSTRTQGILASTFVIDNFTLQVLTETFEV